MKILKILLAIGCLVTLSMACVDKPTCKGDFTVCKKAMSESANSVWKCVQDAKNKTDLVKCEDEKKEINYPIEIKSTCN